VKFASGHTGWSVQDYLALNAVAVPVPATTACSVFAYSSWGSCQSNGTQNRTVNSSSPSGCTGGSPVTTQSCSYIPPVVVASGFTAASVSTHNSASNCWLIISGKVYNVTQYVPFHPGGTANIVNNCGTDATTLFTTSAGHIHSSSAHTLLAGYYVGDIQVAGTVCNSFTYNAWGSCQSDNTQTRSVVGSSPSGCSGGSPVTSQACTYNPTAVTCNSFNYSAWSSCQADNTQTRSVTGSSPSGCAGGNPATSQSCTYVAPTGGLTKADVATHNASGNCWLIISSKVYNVTQYIPFHPGGTARIVNACGTDATTLFTTNAGHTHSTSAHNLLAGYYMGDVQATVTTCSSFTYSAWNSCQVDNTQTRSVTGSGPSGCTGGSPVTSQSCTYGAPPTTCTDFTYSSWGSCQSNSTQIRSVVTSIPSGCSGGSPVTSQSCSYTAPSTPKTYDVSFSTTAGSLSPASLTIAVGDSVRYTFINAGDEQSVRYSPATMPSLKMDHEFTTKMSTFTSAGTWTFTVAGQSGTITVQ
jgi:cytochrome b involved in lipid metabolism